MITNLDTLKSAEPTDHIHQKGCSLLPPEKTLLTICRYNPQNDRSAHNALYASSVTTTRTKWGATTKPELNTEGLPLWLLSFGFHDWLLKSEKSSKTRPRLCICYNQ